MAGGGGGEEGEFGLQIAPMLDVMFVLLLFFMVAAGSNASKEGELGIQIPGQSQASAESTAPQPFIIAIDQAGNIMLNNSPVADPRDEELKVLRGRLAESIDAIGGDSAPVIVAPDPMTQHTRVIQVLDACSYAKVKKLTFRYAGSGKGT
jgi:biopolymer transport protein ExbD